MRKWDDFSAYQVAREILTENPHLMNSLMQGAVAGHEDALKKLKAEISWANMATDAALCIATKRATPANVEFFNQVLLKRFESFGYGTNAIEREFIAANSDGDCSK